MLDMSGGGVALYSITRLADAAPTPWLYPVLSAMLVLMGAQLFTTWTLIKVLSTLSSREAARLRDLNGKKPSV